MVVHNAVSESGKGKNRYLGVPIDFKSLALRFDIGISKSVRFDISISIFSIFANVYFTTLTYETMIHSMTQWPIVPSYNGGKLVALNSLG